MTAHRILDTPEAFLTREERLFAANVRQFPAKPSRAAFWEIVRTISAGLFWVVLLHSLWIVF